MSDINHISQEAGNNEKPETVECTEGLIWQALKMEPYEPSDADDQFAKHITDQFVRHIKGVFVITRKSNPVLYVIHSSKEIMKMRKTRLKKLWKQ